MYLVVWYHGVERVVCVNPRRRRWCRDGIPDSGNAVQIPSLLPPDCHQLLSLPSHYCHTVNTAGGDGCTGCRSQVRCKARRCRCTRQQQHSICPSQSLPLPQNKFLSKAPLSIYFHHCFHLWIHVINAEVMVSFTTSERLIDLVAKVNSVVMIS